MPARSILWPVAVVAIVAAALAWTLTRPRSVEEPIVLIHSLAVSPASHNARQDAMASSGGRLHLITALPLEGFTPVPHARLTVERRTR